MFGRFLRRKSSSFKNEHLNRAGTFADVTVKDELKQYTSVLWSSVSISRSQFDEHYIQTVMNCALYMQDPMVFSRVLKNASDDVAGTMLAKLPYGRNREDGGKYEQLWKYAMFACHLLRGCGEVNRRYYDKEGVRTLVPDLHSNEYYFDTDGQNSRLLVMQNMATLLPGCSSEWILRDEERCFVEMCNAALGNKCFIDTPLSVMPKDNSQSIQEVQGAADQTPNKAAPVAPSAAAVVTDIEKIPERMVVTQPEKPPVDTGLAVGESRGKIMKKPAVKKVKIEDGASTGASTVVGKTINVKSAPSMRVFRRWIGRLEVISKDKDDQSYFSVPDTIEQFLNDVNSDCSTAEYQSKLVSNGFAVGRITDSNKNKVTVMYLPEKTSV